MPLRAVPPARLPACRVLQLPLIVRISRVAAALPRIPPAVPPSAYTEDRTSRFTARKISERHDRRDLHKKNSSPREAGKSSSEKFPVPLGAYATLPTNSLQKSGPRP